MEHAGSKLKLSEFFTLEELLITQQRGLSNEPSPDIIAKLLILAQHMDKVRLLLGKPIIIHSGYRSPQVNAAVGGQANSQHCKGEAADFLCPGYGTPAKVARFLVPLVQDLGIDQLILEYPTPLGGGWTHVSFADVPRHALLTIDGLGTRHGILT